MPTVTGPVPVQASPANPVRLGIRPRVAGASFVGIPPDFPSQSDVRSGIVYGGGHLTGNMTLPTAAQVLIGVTFGGSGTEYTGTVTLPSVGNVRNGTTFGASLGSTGTLVIPSASDVRAGVGFGTSGTQYTGTLVSSTATAYAWSF